MTWPVRSKQLCKTQGPVVANVTFVVGTVPAGKTWLIKHVTFYNPLAGSRTVFLQGVLAGVGYNLDTFGTVGAGSVIAKGQLGIVLVAGDQLAIHVNTSGNVNFTAHGAQLG